MTPVLRVGFLAFPHASESFYSWYINPSEAIWYPGNINNIYSRSCLYPSCANGLLPIATPSEDSNRIIQTSCSETIRQCQLHALASLFLQELESDGGREDGWLFQHFLHSQQGVDLGSCELCGDYSNSKAHDSLYKQKLRLKEETLNQKFTLHW